MPRTHDVSDGHGIIKIGVESDLPTQIEFVYRLAGEAISRVNELEGEVADLREALADLGGPAFRQRLERAQ